MDLGMLQQLLQQQVQQQPTQSLEEELLRHQKPLVSNINAFIDLLTYEKGNMPNNIFNMLLESVKSYLDKELKLLETPVPNASEIVSINGQPVK